jgi:hypothetical protein
VPTPIVNDGMTFATVVTLSDNHDPAKMDIDKDPKQRLLELTTRAFPHCPLRVKKLKLANDYQFTLKVNEVTGALFHDIGNLQTKTCRLVEDFLSVHKESIKQRLSWPVNSLGRHAVLKFQVRLLNPSSLPLE